MRSDVISFKLEGRLFQSTAAQQREVFLLIKVLKTTSSHFLSLMLVSFGFKLLTFTLQNAHRRGEKRVGQQTNPSILDNLLIILSGTITNKYCSF